MKTPATGEYKIRPYLDYPVGANLVFALSFVPLTRRSYKKSD